MSHLFSFLAIFVPLVFIHEFGHFVMAKLGKIRVTKFCFGFGKKLFGFKYRGTEYCWNLLPLGGYVDFMGDVVYTGEIPRDVQHFYNRPKWIRFLVLLMGPLFNLILALAIFWFIFGILAPVEYVSEEEDKTFVVIDVAEGSPEALAGLQRGDMIVGFNENRTMERDDLMKHLVLNPGKPVTLHVDRDTEMKEITFEIDRDRTNGVGKFNFSRGFFSQVHRVVEDSPAEAGGLQSGDLLVGVNGRPMLFDSRDGTLNFLQEQFKANAGGSSVITVERDGQNIDLTVTPEKQDDRWIAGFVFGSRGVRVERTFLTALPRAWDEFVDSSTLILEGLHKLVTGGISIRAMSGPVGVAQMAHESWTQYGPGSFIWLMAVISLNLGLLNLLPIPVLDGGEIFVLGVEWISRKDFNIATKMQVKLVGLVFLVGLMGVVIISDILKFFPGS